MCDFIMNDFEPSSAAAWKQKIQFELQGADYNKTLLTKTNEGITIKPFYHLDDFEKITIPSAEINPKICKKVVISNEKQANLEAIKAFRNGVNSLKFVADTIFNIDEVFRNLLNKNIEFHFQLNFLSEEFLLKLIEFLSNEMSYLNIDIIGNLAKTGNWYKNLNTDFKTIENLLQKNNSKFILSVNANIYQNAGANTVQQVAYALAHVNEYFTKFDANIASKIQFNFATGSNYFFEISKIRAFRYLYNLILSKYNTSANAQIYSEPSLRNKTLFHKITNTFRSNTEIESAVLGGSNTISNEFSSEELLQNNLLKNTQHIVKGTYYIEAITKQITEKALTIFKEIEKSGGFLSQLKEGTIQRKIKENAQKEQTQFESRTLVLVGANKFQNKITSLKEDVDKNLLQKKKARKTLIIPITTKRLSEKLELKKLKNEA
ncbi:heterodimeric methylmalonyl-CoA mutase small subunit [Lutibacter agarilyticus]|uniref:Heterodimeric methylmalonyl-CoA mutase small subunit n=1 Tax=Lutibacter agarilyticus TaxID=1109740 RepID=A0A238WJK9_9FLAO|nr:methylmalonyl-CoA mutase family protein [Lutibacter agarilyticus]SNR46503.1 heterodimeric methylmalonyl-CoA mutase small subunit [Lutibacter agarilyticus]